MIIKVYDKIDQDRKPIEISGEMFCGVVIQELYSEQDISTPVSSFFTLQDARISPEQQSMGMILTLFHLLTEMKSSGCTEDLKKLIIPLVELLEKSMNSVQIEKTLDSKTLTKPTIN